MEIICPLGGETGGQLAAHRVEGVFTGTVLTGRRCIYALVPKLAGSVFSTSAYSENPKPAAWGCSPGTEVLISMSRAGPLREGFPFLMPQK